VFSELFKREKVEQITSGRLSMDDFCKLRSVTRVTVYRLDLQILTRTQKSTTNG